METFNLAASFEVRCMDYALNQHEDDAVAVFVGRTVNRASERAPHQQGVVAIRIEQSKASTPLSVGRLPPVGIGATTTAASIRTRKAVP